MVGGFQIKRFPRALGLLFVVALYISFSFQNAFAASGITYTGRIFKGDQPLDSGVVRFDVWVKTKDNCVLYYERRNIDMTGSSGTYSFEIGDANIIPGSQSFPQSGIQTIGDIFNNAKSRANGDVDTSLPCSTFNPTADEGRLMTVSFTPAGESAQALPDLALTAVPTAFQAFNANKVNGYGTGDLLKVDPTVTKTTYANTPLSQAQYDEFWKLILGTSTTYLKSIPTLGGDVSGTLPAVTVTKIQNVAVTAPTTGDTGKVLTYNGTGMVWSAAAAGGITSLNGETGTTQSFAVGNTGTDFNISSSGGTHTFNIPNASSSNRGLVTSSDWNTFNSKQSSALSSGQVWIGNASNGAQAQTLSGDATVSASGNITVDKTQSATGSKILQLDSSGNAYVAGVDIKGSSATAKLRFTGSTDMVMNLPTTSGTANQFLQTDGAGNLSWGSQSAMLPTISAGQVWVGNASNGAQAFSLTGDIASVSSAGVVTLSSSATGSNKLPLAGGTMSGAINMGGQNISNAGDVSLAAGKFLGLGVGSTAGTVTGQMWYDSGVIKYFDGSSVQSLGVAGAGITSLNGLTSGTQSFVNGTSGTAPAFSSAGSAHTLNIPMASSASVTAGLISNADYASMMAKQSNALPSTQVWVGNASGAAAAVSLSGDVASITNAGVVTVNKTTTGQANYILALDGTGVANVKGLDVQTGTGKVTLQTAGAFTNYVLTLPNAAPAANQIMKSDASGNLSWVTYLANVSDSAPLTNGKMWIGNASGIASEVTMSGDATITNAGLLSLKNTGTVGTYTKVITDAQGRVTSGSALASGDVTAALGYTPADAAAAGYVNGGNTFSGNATIGLNDAYNLGIKTNGATRMTVSGAGNVGIGTTSPANKLHVDGGTSAAENRVALFESTVTGTYNGNAILLNQKQAGSAKNAIIFQGNGTDRWAITNDVVASDTQTFTIYDSVAADSRLTINSSGYTGLGTSWNDSFANQLTVKGNASIGSGYIGNAAPANGLLVQGKVGIATTSPAVMLDVGSATDAIRLPNGTDAQRPTNAKGNIRYNTTSDIVEYNNGSAWVTVGSSLGYTPVNKAGDTMSGDLNTQNLNIAAGKYLGLGAGSTAGTVAGQIWYDSGVIKYFDGTSAKSLGVAGSGITSLNGLTSNIQSFVVGSAGNAPAITSASSAHTLDIPMASASGSVTAGLISNADYASMMAKQSNALPSTQVWVGNASGAAAAVSLSGDIASITNAGVVTVNKTTTGQANYILALDGTGVANVKGLDVQTGTGKVTLQTAGAFTNYTLTLPNAAPAANQIMKSDVSGNLSWVTYLANVSDSAPLTNGKMWIGNASGIASEVTMSGDATITNAGLLSLKNTGTAGTYTKVVTDAQGRVTSGSALANADVVAALGYTPVNKAGDTMTGDLSTQAITMANNKYFGLSNYSGAAGSAAGQMWYDSGNIKYFDGTTAKTLGVAGAGITSINGATVSSQTFPVPGTSGTAPAWSINTGAGSHTLNIPMASASSVTAGLISNTDYAAFNAKMGNSLTGGQIWVGNASNVAQAMSLGGDIASVSNAGVVTLKSVGTAGTYFKVVTDAQGRVTSGAALASGDVTTALGYTPTSAGSGYVNGGNSFTGNATIGLNDNYNLGFKTNNTTKMTLTSDGKLGIGTTTPNTALAIASGDITLDAGYSMMWGQSAYSFINGDSGPSSHLILGTSGAIVMTLDVNGNVGIGTNPAFTLDMGSRTDAVRLPQGTTGQQPANTKGLIRFNTTSNTVEYNNGSAWVTVGSALGYTPVNKAGDTMTGDLNTQNLNIAAGKYLGLGAGSTAGTVAGQMWYDSGVIKYFDGTSAKSLGVAGSGITSLNGLTTGVQSFVIGTSGTAPAFSSAGSAHTLNIPMASAASVTAGLLSNADYTSMMAKQSNTLAAGQMWVGNASGVAQAFSLSGDVSSVSNSGSVVVNKTTTGANNTILSLDGSGVANAYGFGVKGATSGTVTLQAATTTANYSLKLPATTPAANQVMQSDASGNLSWATALTSTTGYVNGGNSFGGAATIGLNDNFNLGFKTNNTTKMTISNTGYVGIGTTGPTNTLQVVPNGVVDAISISRYGTGTTNGSQWSMNVQTAGAGDAAGFGQTSTTYTTGGVFPWAGNDKTFLYYPVALNIGTGTGANPVMTFSNSSNVGIGSATAAVSLDIGSRTDAIRLPNGTTAQQPANAAGLIRYNTSNSNIEFNNGSAWAALATGSGAGYVNGGNSFTGNATIGLNDAYTLGFKTNNTTQMTLTAAGRLGIGTATPSGTLEVQGGTAAASVTGAPITLKAQNGGSGGAVGGSIYLTPGDGTSGWPGGTVVVSTTDGQNGAISANNSTTSSYVTSSGATSAPSYVLRITNGYNFNNNTALIDGTVKNSSALYQEGYMGFVSVTGAANYSPDFILGLQNGATSYQERLRVVGSTGNVGIGTSSPAYSLDFNSKTDAIRLPAGTTAQQPTAAAGLIRYNTSNSNIEFNNGSAWTALATGSGAGYVNGGNSFAGNATIGLNDAYNLGIETNNVTRMTFTGNGNIGILTTSPQAALHIADTNATGSSYSPLTIGTNAGAHVGIDFDSVQAYNGGSNSILYLNYWGGDVGLGDASKWKFNRTTTNLEGAGGGGIAISNAGAISTSSGAISSSSGNIYTTTGKIGSGGTPTYSIDAGTNTDALRLPRGTTAQQPANAAGLIRYNTTNSNIEYNNGSGWSVVATSSGSSGAYINGGNSYTANATIGLNDAYNLGIKTNNATRMTIDASGNVGIGTTSPAAKLDVVGSAAFEDNTNTTTGAFFSFWKSRSYAAVQLNDNLGFFNYYGSDGTSQQRGAFISSNVDNTVAAGSVPANLVFATTQAGGTDSTERMRITSSGNVGINTAPTGNAKLEVSGAIVSTARSVASGATVNLAQGNTTVLASVGGSTITLQNMMNGGNYTLVIQDTTSRTYTFSGCNTSKFSPANQATINGTPSIYNILTIYNGASFDCYITWSTGFQ